MKIITEKKCYKEYYQNFGSKTTLDLLPYKKTLNNHFNPDSYLGFYFPEAEAFVPLVKKNGLVYFFGGDFYNEKNILPTEQVNEVLYYLTQNNLIFRLLSIANDTYHALEDRLKKFDVPYNQNWYIPNVKTFNARSHQLFLSQINKKKSLRIQRSIKKRHNYFLEEVDINDTDRIHDLIEAISSSFSARNKIYDWKEKERLLLKMLNLFSSNMFFYIMHHPFQNEVGWFCVVKNKNRYQNILFNIINKFYENDVIILFLKMMEVLKDNDCTAFDFMRGNFGYKRICGCKYDSLFALTNDSSWVPTYSDDISQQEILQLNQRDYGCFNYS